MKKNLSLLSLCSSILITAGTAHAATITWSTPTTISGDSDVITTGTLFESMYVATSASGSVTVNSVAFAPLGIGTASYSGSTVGNLTYGPTFTNSNINAFGGGATNPYAALSTNYKNIIDGAIYLTGSNAASITLNNLVVGNVYTIQAWVNDSRAAAGRTTNFFDTATPASIVNADLNTTDVLGGLGQFVVGTFTADSATESFSIQRGPSSTVAHLNAIQVRFTAVPEPSTALLSCLGMLAFLRRRR